MEKRRVRRTPVSCRVLKAPGTRQQRKLDRINNFLRDFFRTAVISANRSGRKGGARTSRGRHRQYILHKRTKCFPAPSNAVYNVLRIRSRSYFAVRRRTGKRAERGIFLPQEEMKSVKDDENHFKSCTERNTAMALAQDSKSPEPAQSDLVQPSTGGAIMPNRAVTWRSVLLALLLLPINAYWVVQMEVVRYSAHPTTISLLFNTVFHFDRSDVPESRRGETEAELGHAAGGTPARVFRAVHRVVRGRGMICCKFSCRC